MAAATSTRATQATSINVEIVCKIPANQASSSCQRESCKLRSALLVKLIVRPEPARPMRFGQVGCTHHGS
jgi:hypothetical protein